MYTIMELHDKLVTGLKNQSRSALAVALVTLATTAGCGGGEAETSTYGPPSECDAGPELCTGNTGIGAGSSSSGGMGDGGLQGAEVTGTVKRFAERCFTMSQDYLGAATVIAPAADGTDILAVYSAQTMTFSMSDVATGDRWFFVRDDTAGTTGIYSTYSQHTVSDPVTIAVEVIDTLALSDVANTLPVPVTVDPSKAHAIIHLSRNGMPLSGVSLGTDLTALADIAFDEGGCVYSDQTTVTGAGGTILLLNMDFVPNGEFLKVNFLDAGSQSFERTFPMAANAATIVTFDL